MRVLSAFNVTPSVFKRAVASANARAQLAHQLHRTRTREKAALAVAADGP
jgi:hypothetical protein